VDSGELTANFFFLNVEEAGDVFNHLLMGECQFAVGRAVRRWRGDNIGSIASTVGRGRGAR